MENALKFGTFKCFHFFFFFIMNIFSDQLIQKIKIFYVRATQQFSFLALVVAPGAAGRARIKLLCEIR